MEQEATRQQFPFYNEFNAIFTARMQRMLWAEAEGGSKKNKATTQLSSDEDGNEESTEAGSGRKKKKAKIGLGVRL